MVVIVPFWAQDSDALFHQIRFRSPKSGRTWSKIKLELHTQTKLTEGNKRKRALTSRPALI